MKCINSPTEKIKYNNIDVYIKRDDLLDKEFSGNKARKLYYFLQKDLSAYTKIISYGSVQANSLYSLSALAKIKNLALDYYVYKIPSYLKNNIQGNYKEALALGANIIEIDCVDIKEYLQKNVLNTKAKQQFIDEGARVQEAQVGIKILADEISSWAFENKIKNLKIVLPSGTGTTSLFLQKYLAFEVLTCPCVGDETYLKEQFKSLNNNEKEHPFILPLKKKYHFGKLYKEFYEIYEKLLKQTGLTFELLYDPSAWICLEEYAKKHADEAYTYLYIHQGGILGNESMLARYERKFPKNTNNNK